MKKPNCNFMIIPLSELTDEMIEQCGKTLSGIYNREHIESRKSSDNKIFIKWHSSIPSSLKDKGTVISWEEWREEMKKDKWKVIEE